MYVGQWPTFHGPVILSYILKTTQWINVVLEMLSVTQTLNWNYICRSVTYISWPSDFALYLEDYLMDKCHNWSIGSMWCKDLPIKCMWVSDLHFIVQWFCLISWRLLDGLMLYWRYWFSVTQTLNWNYICRSVTYISWSSDFALYLEHWLMGKCHNWNTGSMWCKDLPNKMYVGQWKTFYGPVILSYILKAVWWINIILEILIQCGTNIELKLYM